MTSICAVSLRHEHQSTDAFLVSSFTDTVTSGRSLQMRKAMYPIAYSCVLNSCVMHHSSNISLLAHQIVDVLDHIVNVHRHPSPGATSMNGKNLFRVTP